MRIVSWNMHWAKSNSPAWDILSDLKPDIALLQEVQSFPSNLEGIYRIKSQHAIRKDGEPQNFSTAILIKGEIIVELQLSSESDWVNRELKLFSGNFISCVAEIQSYPKLNIVSVYSPAWPIAPNKYQGEDISSMKLLKDSNIWAMEILWDALKQSIPLNSGPWIIAGDFNSAPTLQEPYGSGSQEELDRMANLGLVECLKHYSQKSVPTFKNSTGGKIIHQIDHLFVSPQLSTKLKKCYVEDKVKIFSNNSSDHLPIIADF